MARSRVVALAAVALVGTAAAAHAGPCTAQIAGVERYLGRLALGPDRFTIHRRPAASSADTAVGRALLEYGTCRCRSGARPRTKG